MSLHDVLEGMAFMIQVVKSSPFHECINQQRCHRVYIIFCHFTNVLQTKKKEFHTYLTPEKFCKQI